MKHLICLLLLLVGCKGPQGNSGSPGTPGINVNPHPVSWVQFCPNYVTQYPNTFPEGGFCMDGNVYAVYSENDGFLTLIPPGTYNSNAVGSACTFTVLPNCVVQ